MARGKKTGGRRAGTANKKTRKLADEVMKSGLSPLEYLLGVMRTPMMPELKKAVAEGRIDEETINRLTHWHQMRYNAAKDAAPYVHPRLQTTQLKGSGEQGEIVGKLKIKYVHADRQAAR